MSSKDPASAAAEGAARELVKAAYPDLLRRPSQEVGDELLEFVRVIMTAGRGFGYVIRETFLPFYLKAISKVPRDQLVLPSAEIAGPILEGVTYLNANSNLYEMFEALLANASDSERVCDVHPSFPKIIPQISRDEALILQHLEHEQIDMLNDPASGDASEILVLDTIDDIADPSRGLFYHRHLKSLGLVFHSGPAYADVRVIDGVSYNLYKLNLSVLGRAFIKATKLRS